MQRIEEELVTSFQIMMHELNMKTIVPSLLAILEGHRSIYYEQAQALLEK
jgi:hypothetical protein